MDRIQLACYSLTASAFILAALLIASLHNPLPQAQANMVVAKDTYTFLTAQTANDEESLFVIDNFNQKLLVYKTNLRGERGRLELSTIEDLTKIFESGAPAAGGRGRGRAQ